MQKYISLLCQQTDMRAVDCCRRSAKLHVSILHWSSSVNLGSQDSRYYDPGRLWLCHADSEGTDLSCHMLIGDMSP